MKVFITFSPQQERLSGFEYEPQENERLAYGKTCFPIIPAINGYAVPGEPFRVILVVQDYEFCQNNAAVFHQELRALCEEKGLTCQEVRELHVPFDDQVSSQREIFLALTDAIRDGDDIHACITYGSKPASTTELMVLRFARQLRKNTYISCIVYGQVNFKKGEAKLYDETALVNLDDIIRVLAQSGTPEPEKVLKNLIKM